MTNEEEDKELKRKAILLESLHHNEAFKVWRAEVCEPTIDRIDILLAGADNLEESVVRANVKLRYLLKDMFYTVFEQVKAANDRERDLTN